MVAGALALWCGAVAAAQDAAVPSTPTAEPARAAVPVPERVWIEDTPNDDGRKLTVRWLGADGEDADGVEVYVELATKPDGPWLPAAGPLPARGAWFRDLRSEYGPFTPSGTEAGHAVVVEPLSLDPIAPHRLLELAMMPPGDPRRVLGEREVEAILGKGALAKVREIIAAHGVKERAGIAGHVEGRILEEVSYFVLERPWYARLVLRAPGRARRIVAAEAPLAPQQNLFNLRKLNNFVFMVLLSAVVLIMIRRARRNPDLYLRRIPGLDAVDEALGRATEMGKPVLFVHGLNPMDSPSTIAAVNILGEVAKKVARYDSQLLVTCADPIVLAVSQETVKEAYTHAGRPDAYRADDVFLAASEQFAYVAAVDGIMMRKKPAANFYVGYFYAESLLLAETGAASGAIQIAATDSFTQLPFFVTTCDYTLMGEELYAASAYLSRDPLLLGSLKGQDWGKAVIIVVLLLGTILASFDIGWFDALVQTY
ncbi:MAG: hypothetical protein D6776_10595 [Planctomycetota bacterium]|nr:MAG: hypothetical protein D6776_10595 [Planctomycetota bacterium]